MSDLTIFTAPSIGSEIIVPGVNGRTNYEHAKACIDANPEINPGTVLVKAMVEGDRFGRKVYLPREDLCKIEEEYGKLLPSVDNLCEIEDSVTLFYHTGDDSVCKALITSYCPEILENKDREEPEI